MEITLDQLEAWRNGGGLESTNPILGEGEERIEGIVQDVELQESETVVGGKVFLVLAENAKHEISGDVELGEIIYSMLDPRHEAAKTPTEFKNLLSEWIGRRVTCVLKSSGLVRSIIEK